MNTKLTLFIILCFILPHFGSSQEHANSLDYQVHIVHPPLSISHETLQEAQTIMDLNAHYQPSWVKKYVKVETITFHQGKIKKVLSYNDALTQQQKDNLYKADVGSDITLKVHYIPENTLTNNDVKKFNFTFLINPQRNAHYPAQQDIMEILREKIISKIPKGTFLEYDLAAIKFTISPEGEVINTHVFESSEDDNINRLMIETIQNMPCWIPAEYNNGTTVSQDFVLLVGNMENCHIPRLNIRPNPKLKTIN